MTWSVDSYSSTPASNTTINGINIGEGCNASGINDAIRQLMADIAVRIALVSTRQILLSGTGATYTTPSGVKQLRIRMVGAGGGGGGGYGTANGNTGVSGGATLFNGIAAAAGAGGSGGTPTTSGLGGAGGTGGTGIASWRSGGQGGSAGLNTPGGAPGSAGGNSVLGGGGLAGIVSEHATGYGGGGGGSQSGPNGFSGGGGGGGEYVEIVINTPAATYSYTIGAGGTGSSGAGSYAAGDGKQGIIIVDEIYQ